MVTSDILLLLFNVRLYHIVYIGYGSLLDELNTLL